MNVNPNEMFAIKFAGCMNLLCSLGLKAEVAVVAGLVMVSTDNKHSASAFRRAIKKACKKTQTLFVETRPKKGFYVFTIVA